MPIFKNEPWHYIYTFELLIAIAKNYFPKIFDPNIKASTNSTMKIKNKTFAI